MENERPAAETWFLSLDLVKIVMLLDEALAISTIARRK
jgi:hypothetical protein